MATRMTKGLAVVAGRMLRRPGGLGSSSRGLSAQCNNCQKECIKNTLLLMGLTAAVTSTAIAGVEYISRSFRSGSAAK
ncbi:hypothetical protein E2562_027167 [Oryza meyeriana var. granulata]|uniref:Uncharacterized protein n=1 Tax=Oryza meyeriana var. granulata TaxID=110450 RepID=A0A6G1EQ44_9ORYZ|nr:hypothetical protein E2562_027167 [Oryza meyeriana var. granulata]